MISDILLLPTSYFRAFHVQWQTLLPAHILLVWEHHNIRSNLPEQTSPFRTNIYIGVTHQFGDVKIRTDRRPYVTLDRGFHPPLISNPRPRTRTRLTPKRRRGEFKPFGGKRPLGRVAAFSSRVLLLNGDHGGVVDGLHDGGQAAAQVMGRAHVDLRRVFEDHRLS